MAQHSFTTYAVSELSCRESWQRAALQKTRFISFRTTKRKRGCLGTRSAHTCNSFDLDVQSNSVNASKTRKIFRFVQIKSSCCRKTLNWKRYKAERWKRKWRIKTNVCRLNFIKIHFFYLKTRLLKTFEINRPNRLPLNFVYQTCQ